MRNLASVCATQQEKIATWRATLAPRAPRAPWAQGPGGQARIRLKSGKKTVFGFLPQGNKDTRPLFVASGHCSWPPGPSRPILEDCSWPPGPSWTTVRGLLVHPRPSPRPSQAFPGLPEASRGLPEASRRSARGRVGVGPDDFFRKCPGCLPRASPGPGGPWGPLGGPGGPMGALGPMGP